MFAEAGRPYEDKRLTQEEWGQFKPSESEADVVEERCIDLIGVCNWLFTMIILNNAYKYMLLKAFSLHKLHVNAFELIDRYFKILSTLHSISQ